jgi:hypothetical protein
LSNSLEPISNRPVCTAILHLTSVLMNLSISYTNPRIVILYSPFPKSQYSFQDNHVTHNHKY